MRIVVMGGHGLIGSRTVQELRRLGHEVAAASRRNGVDAVSGEGLDAALAGAQVLVDASNAPSFEDPEVTRYFQRSTTRLLDASVRAGVGHYIALSVVGTPYLQSSAYFRGKAAQERLVREARLPATVVRATQCFEFMAQLIPAADEPEPVRLPLAEVQPVAADDVAALLAQIAISPPSRHSVQIGGPERHRLFELVEWVMYFNQDDRPVVGDAQARYYGALLKDLTLTAEPGALVGPTRFAGWLSSHVAGQFPRVNLPDPLR